ncbi:uncharacterized protein LOC125468209 [Pyrus x bretschneideri]|uniref:uncharacterized protein LOC125468209 n=1 Tax=Pyrus x bretschneideri TaxID=225117 RepID=UPI00202E83AD|nr:uncharacterized protein LOC125468209 [Pyrus x bretschneideri]
MLVFTLCWSTYLGSQVHHSYRHRRNFSSGRYIHLAASFLQPVKWTTWHNEPSYHVSSLGHRRWSFQHTAQCFDWNILQSQYGRSVCAAKGVAVWRRCTHLLHQSIHLITGNASSYALCDLPLVSLLSVSVSRRRQINLASSSSGSGS